MKFTRITANPQQMGGVPCIRGLRIPVASVVDMHRRYLGEARRLAKADPAPQSDDGARLELLAKLIDDYERARFKFRKPDPIEPGVGDPFPEAAAHAFDGSGASRETRYSERALDPRAGAGIPGAQAWGQAGPLSRMRCPYFAASARV